MNDTSNGDSSFDDGYKALISGEIESSSTIWRTGLDKLQYTNNVSSDNPYFAFDHVYAIVSIAELYCSNFLYKEALEFYSYANSKLIEFSASSSMDSEHYTSILRTPEQVEQCICWLTTMSRLATCTEEIGQYSQQCVSMMKHLADREQIEIRLSDARAQLTAVLLSSGREEEAKQHYEFISRLADDESEEVILFVSSITEGINYSANNIAEILEMRILANRRFRKAFRRLSKSQYRSAISLYREGIKHLESIEGESPDPFTQHYLAEIIAQVGKTLLDMGPSFQKDTQRAYDECLGKINKRTIPVFRLSRRLEIAKWYICASYLQATGFAASPNEEYAREAISILEPLHRDTNSEDVCYAEICYQLSNALGAMVYVFICRGDEPNAKKLVGRIEMVSKEIPVDQGEPIVQMLEDIKSKIRDRLWEQWPYNQAISPT